MNEYICTRELIFYLSRDVSLGRLCSNSLISSATTTSRNLTSATRGCKIVCKRVFFFWPRLGVLPHLPGVPHPPCQQVLTLVIPSVSDGRNESLQRSFFTISAITSIRSIFRKIREEIYARKPKNSFLKMVRCFLLVRKMVSLKDGFTAETSSSKYWKLVTLTNLLVTSAVTRREKRFVLNSVMLLLNFKIVVTI